MKQIYVHGLGQTSDSWTKTIDILQTTDYSLCPNLPDLVHSKEVTYDNYMLHFQITAINMMSLLICAVYRLGAY